MHYIRIWSSRTGNVLHSSRESAFACLLFNKVEEVQHSIVIPSDSHSGINYPPFANANGFETTDCLECLQILDILIYGRRVCFRIWSSRTGNILHFPFWRNFSILSFYKKYSASHRPEFHRNLPTADKVCDLYPFSPERKKVLYFARLCNFGILTFIHDIKKPDFPFL